MNAPSILYKPDTTIPVAQAENDSPQWMGNADDYGPRGQPSKNLSEDANNALLVKSTQTRGKLRNTKKVCLDVVEVRDKEKGSEKKIRKPKRALKSQPTESTPSSPRNTLISFSDKFDPFTSLPIHLNKFQEHLVSFYLYHYPHATYGFSTRLQPHPVATNFAIALDTPACFQVILARSAMYRTSLQTYSSDREKNALELAMLRHKVEAIRLVHRSSVDYNRTRDPKAKDDLLASIMSLGNLDRRSGSVDSADMHYTAIRRLLKATGGPLAIRSPMLKRVSVFFECIYGTSPNSYIWDKSDVADLLSGLNDFLQRVEKVWRESPTIDETKSEAAAGEFSQNVYLRPDSTLLVFLSRGPQNETGISRGARLELIWQMTTLLTLAALVVDLHDEPAVLRSYMDNIYKMVEELRLSALDASNNIMWLTQVSDHSDEHSKRILDVAGWAWVCKHLNFSMQVKLKDWLLHFLKGGDVAEPFKFTTFHFSYAS